MITGRGNGGKVCPRCKLPAVALHEIKVKNVVRWWCWVCVEQRRQTERRGGTR